MFEFHVFRRSGVMSRCAAMSGTWSEVLYIDLEVKNSLTVMLLGDSLNLRLADRVQDDMIGMNESYRPAPHSVLHCRNVWFNMFDGQNHLRSIKITFSNHMISWCNGQSSKCEVFDFKMRWPDHILSLKWPHMSQHVVKHVFPWIYTRICDYLISNGVI